MDCPDADTLASLVGDGLSADDRAAVANHAAACPSCHEVVAALMGWQAAQGTAPTAAGGRRGDAMRLEAGAKVDRYVIEARLGAGGMGVVYAARDPDLGRRVAVKLLRARSDDERLRREAQALARLSHPNVVAIHDVGTYQDRTFVAMALVDGANLRQWVRTPRSVDAIVGHLLAAGRGLVAAHGAGLIHRDLKPDNIFIEDGGHALVGDFGLARALDAPDDATDGGEPDDAMTMTIELTITGTVIGTPAYMAPEQADGEATAASDQFSFCVTAWEALYGERPYGGQSFSEIQEAVRAGRITPPRVDPGVPAAVHRALRRGLATDPAARFPSVDALLAAMTPRPRRWPWRVAALGGTAIAAAAVVIVLARGAAPDAATRCAGTDASPAGWTPARRAALALTLRTRAPDAAAAIDRVIATVDRYAAGWSTMRRDVCRATDPRRTDLLASRNACLDHRALALRATIDLIVEATAMAPHDAWTVVDDVRTFDRCARASDADPPRRSPALDRARLQLAELGARVDDRWADLIAARAGIEALGDPSLLLDALLLESQVALGRAEPVLAEAAARRGLAVAEQLRDDLGRAHVGALLSTALVRLDRLPEAHGQIAQAVTALERGGGDWEVGIVVGEAGAIIARAAGDQPAEIAAWQLLLDEQRRRRSDDSRGVLHAALELATAYQRAGRLAEAQAMYAIVERAFGATMPDKVAAAAHALFAGSQTLLAGDFTSAISHGRVLVALSDDLGLPADEVAANVHSLARAHDLAGDAIAARDGYRDTVRRYRAIAPTPVATTRLAEALEALASLELQLGDADAALPPAREALAIARAIDDRELVQIASLSLGRVLLARGEELGEVVALLEPLLRALDATPVDPARPPNRRASAAYGLAQALWATGGDRERARARSLVRDAVRDFTLARDWYALRPVYATGRQLVEARLAEATEWQARH